MHPQIIFTVQLHRSNSALAVARGELTKKVFLIFYSTLIPLPVQLAHKVSKKPTVHSLLDFEQSNYLIA